MIGLPILGIDIVYLPKSHVVAIDLQPLSANESYFTHPAYLSHTALFQHWQTRLATDSSSSSSSSPPALPSEVKRYFSPYAVWLRKATSSPFEDIHEYGDCLKAYLGVYCQSMERIAAGEAANGLRSSEDRADFEREYLEYRIENDPAKNILNRVFGEEWTSAVIRDFLFPVAPPQSSSQ